MTTMPPWEEFMRPVLEVLCDQVVRDRRELGLEVAKYLNLTEDQIQETTASGQPRYLNRMGWGLSFMSNVGALARPSRGLYTITDAGRWLLAKFPNGFGERDVKALGDDPDAPISTYVATASRKTDSGAKEIEESALTPTEQVQNGIARINEEIGAELLLRLQGKEPAFFEQAVVDLLLAMGYGGAKGRGGVTPISRDAGIDGVIDQDVLGLSRVYIQAKRYADGNTVGRPDVQAFVGALSGLADSGVFITTSKFSDGAAQYAKDVPTRIILIDGKKLTELMIRFSVGVQVSETYNIVEIDEDFFA
jgi:restriction system protein